MNAAAAPSGRGAACPGAMRASLSSSAPRVSLGWQRLAQDGDQPPSRRPHTALAARDGTPGAAASAAAPPPPGGPLRNPDGSNTVFGFQCNERYLQWDDSATRQLIRLHAAHELGTDVRHVSAKLEELAVLLPGLVGRLERMEASLVVRLVADTEAVARRLLDLRAALDGVDVSAAVAAAPWLLSEPGAEALRVQMAALRGALPGLDVEACVLAEPRLLLADVPGVLAELRRLAPSVDPARLLAADPGIVLGMREAGLPSSLTVDDGITAG